METVATKSTLDMSVIDRSLPILGNARGIYETHLTRVSKAKAVVDSILVAVEANGGKLTPELDLRIQNFLATCSKAKKELEESRKPVTQTMDLIRKLYTAEENKIDVTDKNSLVYQLQQLRNEYAKELLLEQQRQEKEREEKAAKAKEEVEIRAAIKNSITQCLIDFLSRKKLSITTSFNNITLENFNDKSAGLKLMPTDFPLEKLGEVLKYDNPFYSKHTFQEFSTIKHSEHAQFDFPAFYNEFKRQITELKQSLIDKLPSKKQELEALAKAGEEEKARLEKEKLEREEAEKKRLQEEEFLAKQKAEKEVEAQKMAGETQILFDQSMEAANISAPLPEVRQKLAIVVTHPAGWTEIFALWFQHEGAKLSSDDLEKMTFKKMKTFCEDKAYKDDLKISSKYIKYEPIVKAVNRKA